MSLSIPRKHIYKVMLGNKWVECDPGTFYIDAYEYVYEPGDEDYDAFHSGREVTSYGFTFKSEFGNRIAGPMTSIQAVGYEDEAFVVADITPELGEYLAARETVDRIINEKEKKQ